MAALTDWYTFKLARAMTNAKVARWALFTQLTCWFNFFCLVRTFSNVLETLLTVMAIFHFPGLRPSATMPSRKCDLNRCFALALAAWACAVRPTSAVLWLVFVPLSEMRTRRLVPRVMAQASAVGAAVFGVTMLVDRWCYGRWIIVPWNFFVFNVIEGGSSLYGGHPVHWYVTSGLPTILFTFAPLLLVGLQVGPLEPRLLAPVVVVLGCLSIIAHKEFRFMMPLMPVAVVYIGIGLDNLQRRHSKRHVKLLVGFLAISHLAAALYTSCVHQRGTTDVMLELRMRIAELQHTKLLERDTEAVHFLMPCHSTPYFSQLHYDVNMRFLDCSPAAIDDLTAVDEADQFYADPAAFVGMNYASAQRLPIFFVMFDELVPRIDKFLERNSYRMCSQHFHTHFALERRISSYVQIWCKH